MEKIIELLSSGGVLDVLSEVTSKSRNAGVWNVGLASSVARDRNMSLGDARPTMHISTSDPSIIERCAPGAEVGDIVYDDGNLTYTLKNALVSNYSVGSPFDDLYVAEIEFVGDRLEMAQYTSTSTATYMSASSGGGWKWDFYPDNEVKEMAKNQLRMVYVVRREKDTYAFAQYGPFVSKDPETLIRQVLLKFGKDDAIFADVDLESDDLTFVVQTIGDAVIPELED